MADYYVDHGAYASALGTTPTWGVPQEGDGTSKDAATSSAVASIAFSSIPTTGTISVCGASVSTTGVIGAVSADAAANALAANINATTNTVSTTFANATTTNANQLRNVAFARGPSGGAPAGTCQIMMRGGSASHNTTGIASTLDGSPTLSQFSGGSGGCWGWFINPSALGVSSSIAALQYGLFLYVPLFGATPGVNDTVWVRTGGGASKTIALSVASSTTLTHAAYSKNMVFDTNTKWTTDATDAALKIVWTASAWGLTNYLVTTVYGQAASYIALRRGGFILEYINTQNSGTLTVMAGNSGGGTCAVYYKNWVFMDSATPVSAGVGLGISGGASSVSTMSAVFEGCEWRVTVPRSIIARPLLQFGLYQTYGNFYFLGCTFDYNILGVSDPGALLVQYSSSNDFAASFEGCSFVGFSSGYTFLASPGGYATAGAKLHLTVDNCSGLKMPSSYVGLPSSTVFFDQALHQLVFSNASLSSQAGERIEDCRGVAEWLPDDSTPFPYLSATLLGSGAPYSVRLIWIRAVAHTRGRVYKAPPLRMTTQLSAGVRALTVNMLAPSDMSGNIKCAFQYIDSSGVARCEDTEVVQSSTATWTNAGSYAGYSAKKFSLTTSYPVKANSEIVATIHFFGPPPGASATVAVYVDPEFTVV